MTTPTIYVNLSSLDTGSVPTVTTNIDVNEGGQLDVNITWPSSAPNTIQCDLNFQGSGDQDPINDVTGGDTSFSPTRTSSSESAVNTFNINQKATITTDTYILTLTIDGIVYSTDPTIKVGGKK
jgi:hypothetical protein